MQLSQNKKIVTSTNTVCHRKCILRLKQHKWAYDYLKDLIQRCDDVLGLNKKCTNSIILLAFHEIPYKTDKLICS